MPAVAIFMLCINRTQPIAKTAVSRHPSANQALTKGCARELAIFRTASAATPTPLKMSASAMPRNSAVTGLTSGQHSHDREVVGVGVAGDAGRDDLAVRLDKQRRGAVSRGEKVDEHLAVRAETRIERAVRIVARDEHVVREGIGRPRRAGGDDTTVRLDDELACEVTARCERISRDTVRAEAVVDGSMRVETR